MYWNEILYTLFPLQSTQHRNHLPPTLVLPLYNSPHFSLLSSPHVITLVAKSASSGTVSRLNYTWKWVLPWFRGWVALYYYFCCCCANNRLVCKRRLHFNHPLSFLHLLIIYSSNTLLSCCLFLNILLCLTSHCIHLSSPITACNIHTLEYCRRCT